MEKKTASPLPLERWEVPEVIQALAGVVPAGTTKREVLAAAGAPTPSTSDAVVPHTEDSPQSQSSTQAVPEVELQPKHTAALSAKYAASKVMCTQRELHASTQRAPGMAVLQEIRKYQSTSELFIRRAPFARLIQGAEIRWQSNAIMAIQEVSEQYLVNCLRIPTYVRFTQSVLQ